MTYNPTYEQHCINVLKVYDWISKQTVINLSRPFFCQDQVTDEISGNIRLQGGENLLLWQVNGNLSVSGDITVLHEKGCQYMKFIVNKKYEYILSQGEERTINLNNLQSLEVRCIGSVGSFCFGKYCLMVQYKINKGCFSPRDCKLICFLSDQYGNPVDSIICQEILQTPSRQILEVVNPKGEKILLQKVKVLLNGFFTIQVLINGTVCEICTIPFRVTEEHILCAPTGTFLKCIITDLNCIAYFTDDCKSVDVVISFCQQIQMVNNVNVEVEGKLCVPQAN